MHGIPVGQPVAHVNARARVCGFLWFLLHGDQCDGDVRVVSGAGPWSGPFPAVYIEALAAVDDLVGTGRLDEAHMLAADAVTAAEVDGERPALQAVLLQRLAEVALRQGKVWEVGSL